MKVSAPGKLFLFGEYAVLEGAPAVLTPVPQRATVSLVPTKTSTDQSKVIATESTTRELSLPDAIASLPLLNAVVQPESFRAQLEDHSLSLDTHQFFRDGIKLGLGSSAALTAALIKLLSPDAPLNDQLALAVQSHLRFQSGKGSGADIALSLLDQPIVFQRGQSPRPICVPDDLYMLAIWSHEAASTTDFLKRVSQWQQQAPTDYQKHIDGLSATARAAVALLSTEVSTHETPRILATIEQYGRQLAEFSSNSGVNFYNLTHLEMRKRVELVHCVYKPSGAGGGDFGIAYSTNRNELFTLAENLKHEGRYVFFLEDSASEIPEQ